MNRDKWEKLAAGFSLTKEGRQHAEIAVRLIMEGRKMDEIVDRLTKVSGKQWHEDWVWNLLMMNLRPEERAQVWDRIEKFTSEQE